MHILKALVALHPCTKFGDISPKGVGTRGHKAEKRIDPCGVNFDPSGSKLTWHMCHTRDPGCTYPASFGHLNTKLHPCWHGTLGIRIQRTVFFFLEGKLWRRGPNLPTPIFNFLFGFRPLYFEITEYWNFYFMFISHIYSVVRGANGSLYGFGEGHGPKCSPPGSASARGYYLGPWGTF